MANKKNFWYVLVMTETGPTFVTSVSHADKWANWNKDEKPQEMSEFWAKSLASGLCLNMHLAYAVCNGFELNEQPYRYNLGELKWNAKEEGDE